MKIDYQFLALAICSVFGWTIEQVFRLTYRQFAYIAQEVQRVQFMRAKNESYFSLCAAFGDKKTQKEFLNASGHFVIQDDCADLYKNISEEDMRKAQERQAKLHQPSTESEVNNNG